MLKALGVVLIIAGIGYFFYLLVMQKKLTPPESTTNELQQKLDAKTAELEALKRAESDSKTATPPPNI